MKKLTAIVSGVMLCGALSADGYVYQITEPVATVNYPVVSTAVSLSFVGWGCGSAIAQEQTNFAGWTRAVSSDSALDARKPTGTMLLFR